MSSTLRNQTPHLAVIMVGLPARGKTYVGAKIARYLNWLDIKTRVFNVGTYRRKQCGAELPASFFDPNNSTTSEARLAAANTALSDMLDFLENSDGIVAIYDATNSTRERRDMVVAACRERSIEVIFIESICNEQRIVMDNIREVKLSSPDYANVNPEQASADFLERIEYYNKRYEPVENSEGSYIKLVNAGKQYILQRIHGFLQSRIVFFIMNLHIRPRFIYLSRHGESMFNLSGKIGGDSDLGPRGQEYARRLPAFFAEQLGNANLTVWMSTFKRTQQTAQHLTYRKLAWRALDEIDAGVCDGLTYEEISERYPDDFAARDDDKFNYRYRGGESYRDLVLRVEPIIMELERQENILVVGHQAVLRAIYAYFMNYPLKELPYVEVPLHTVIKITPRAYGTQEERFPFNISAVSTHRDPRRGAHSKPASPVIPAIGNTTTHVQPEI